MKNINKLLLIIVISIGLFIIYGNIKNENIKDIENINKDIEKVEKIVSVKSLEVVKNKCSDLEGTELAKCKRKFILNTALKTSDANECDNMDVVDYAVSCKNAVYTKLANISGDEKMCYKLIDESQYKYKIKDCKNNIMLDKALKTNDINNCDKLEDEGMKQICKDMLQINILIEEN